MSTSELEKRAKNAYKTKLEKDGYKNVMIISTPADISAFKDGKEHYFEIKASASKGEFGASTETEWKSAFEKGDCYSFVFAFEDKDGSWEFYYPTKEELFHHSRLILILKLMKMVNLFLLRIEDLQQ
jgi:hypothetical protein